MKASERLSFTYLGKAARGKAKAKTGIGKSDLPGLQGGPRKRDSVSYDPVRAPRLYPDPEEPIHNMPSINSLQRRPFPFRTLSPFEAVGTGANHHSCNDLQSRIGPAEHSVGHWTITRGLSP